MAYTVNTYVPYFVELPPSAFVNGVQAHGRMFKNLADNEHWLGITDCPMEQFICETVSNATIVFTVDIPPFAQFAEFYFFSSKNMSKNTTDDIQVSADSSSLATSYGMDANTSIARGGWTYFNGLYGFSDDSPGIIRLTSSQSAAWTSAEVTVTIGTGCEVYSGFYRILPAKEYTA